MTAIYFRKINSRKMSGKPSCIFKSSTSMATLALSMDHSDSTSPRKDCYAYFDAKHDRTIGMKTITLWTYDPSTQKILQLAVMESDREDTESLTIFWECFKIQLIGAVWKTGKDVVARAFSCELTL